MASYLTLQIWSKCFNYTSKMSKNISETKSRILQFANSQQVTREFFFKDLGINYANFRGNNLNSAVGSDFLERLLSKYSYLSAEWLLRGKGEMLLTTSPNVEITQNNTFGNNHSTAESSKDESALINELRERITELKADKERLFALLASK